MAFQPYYNFQLPGYWEMLIYALAFVVIFIGGPYLLAWLMENMFQG